VVQNIIIKYSQYIPNNQRTKGSGRERERREASGSANVERDSLEAVRGLIGCDIP
jgi:hypothetical protein